MNSRNFTQLVLGPLCGIALALGAAGTAEAGSLTWTIVDDNDAGSGTRSARGLALSDGEDDLYVGFIQGSSTAGFRHYTLAGDPPVGTTANFYNVTTAPPPSSSDHQGEAVATDDRGIVYGASIKDGTSGDNARVYLFDATLGTNTRFVLSDIDDPPSDTEGETIGDLAIRRDGGVLQLYVTRFRDDSPWVERYVVGGTGVGDATLTLDTSFNGTGRYAISGATHLRGIDVADDGTIFIASRENDTVYRISADLVMVTTATVVRAMDVALFGDNAYVTRYDGTASEVVELDQLTLAATGNTYTATGTFPHSFAGTGYSGIDIDSQGRLYVCDQFYMDDVDRILVSSPLPQPALGTLSLEAQDTCVAGSSVTVELWMRDLTDNATGFQAFLAYDDSILSYNGGSSSYTGAPFPQHIQSIGTAEVSPGEIRLDGSDSGGGGGTDADSLLATLVFDVDVACLEDGTVVEFDLTQLFDSELSLEGDPFVTNLSNSEDIVIDGVAPTITCGPDITVNADAGFCTAVLDFNEPFDDPVTTGPSQAPGTWYTDRYAPAVFESAVFDGDNRLCHGVDVADNNVNRPGSFSSGFYDTQGRKYDVDMPVGTTIGVDLWVPADAQTNLRRAGMWATTFDLAGSISGFPIIGFTSALEDETGLGTPRFRVFVQDTDLDPGNGFTPGWIDLVDLTSPTDFDRWYRLETTLTPTAYEFRIYDDTDALVASLDDPVIFGSVRFGNYILQVKNFPDPLSETYTMYWDNVELGPQGPVTADACDTGGTVTFERSDGPLLGLDDPFPSGTTTITWTAEDACGNTATCEQDVTVEAVNTVCLDVQLVGVTTATTRCIHFVTDDCNVTVDVELDFDSSGLFSGTIEVPCGSWTQLCAKDEQHTKWDTADLVLDGSKYALSPSTPVLELRAGDTDNDGDVDINDVTLLFAQFGGPEPFGGCPWDGTRGADFNNDGTVSTPDYSLLTPEWLTVSDCDCTTLIGGGIVRGGRTSVPVAELEPWLAARADMNTDGVVDYKDVSILERQLGLPDHLSEAIKRSDRLRSARPKRSLR